MGSRWLALAVLSVVTAASATAAADPAPPPAQAAPAHAAGKQGGFPKSAAVFQSALETRIARMRERATKRSEGKSADEQRAIKSALDSDVAALRASAAKATRDGVVTREEAREIRREARARHRERARARRGACRRGEHHRGGAPK